jgi:hypothetical protein
MREGGSGCRQDPPTLHPHRREVAVPLLSTSHLKNDKVQKGKKEKIGRSYVALNVAPLPNRYALATVSLWALVSAKVDVGRKRRNEEEKGIRGY